MVSLYDWLAGVSTVSRAVINEEEKNDRKTYHLLVEGYGLREVMATPGTDNNMSQLQVSCRHERDDTLSSAQHHWVGDVTTRLACLR